MPFSLIHNQQASPRISKSRVTRKMVKLQAPGSRASAFVAMPASSDLAATLNSRSWWERRYPLNARSRKAHACTDRSDQLSEFARKKALSHKKCFKRLSRSQSPSPIEGRWGA